VQFPGQDPEPWNLDRQTQLFALLALNEGRPISRSAVEDELWDIAKKAHPNPVVSHLRTRLDEAGLPDIGQKTGSSFQLELPADCSIDCLEAVAQIEGGRQKADEGDLDAAWSLLRDAISALDLEFLEGCQITPFVSRKRDELNELLYEARLSACELALRGGETERRVTGVRDAKSAIRQKPTHEEPYKALIALLIEADEFPQALDVCDQFKRATEGYESASIEQLRAEINRRISRTRDTEAPLILSVARGDEDADFVGRDPLLQMLEETIQFVVSEKFIGRVLVGGKGVGKSRLAREFGALAHQRGCAVLSTEVGRKLSQEDDACQPLIAAIRGWVDRVEPLTVEAVSYKALAEIARFAPDLGKRVNLPAPTEGYGLDKRLRASVIEVLRDIAKIHPTVLLVDDVCDVDSQTWWCLQEICKAQPGGLMVLATAPPEGAGDLKLRQHRVDALESDEAATLAQSVLGASAGQDEVAELVAKAERNPYLIVHRTEPDRIERDFVRPQIKPLGDKALEVIRMAALLGAQFDLDVLREAVGDAEIVDRTITLAEERNLVIASRQAGSFLFKHSLNRDAILSGIPSIERSNLSERLAFALPGKEQNSAARLRLLQEADPSPERSKPAAAVAAVEAGDYASERASYAAALGHYEEGRKLVSGSETRLHGRFLIGIAQSLWSLGRYAEAREAFLEAIQLPDLDPTLRAVAALGFGGKLGFGGATTDRQYIGVLKDALAVLPPPHRELRVRLQAALAGALTFSARDREEREERDRLVARALDGLDEIDDPSLRAEVLSDVCWTAWDPHEPDARRKLAAEFVEIADASRDVGLAIEARIFRIASSLEDGEMRIVRQEMHRAAALTRQAGLAHFEALMGLLEGMDSLLSGDLEAAVRFSDEALTLGGREQNPAVFELYGAQVLLIHVFQGRTDKIRAAAEALAGAFPQMPAWKAGLGLIYAELGRLSDARRQLELIGQDDFRGIPRDLFWLVTLDHAARLAAILEDRERSELLYDLLVPFAGRVVVAGAAVGVYGAIDRSLGLLAGALGHTEQGIEHLRDAIEINEAIGATAINAYVSAELATLLRTSGNRGEADVLQDRARAVAAEMGLSLGPCREAQRFSEPAHPPGAIGSLRQIGAHNVSQLIRRAIEGKSDHGMQQFPGTRLLRRLMPVGFMPSAACGWQGEIELEFEPPIGFRDRKSVV